MWSTNRFYEKASVELVCQLWREYTQHVQRMYDHDRAVVRTYHDLALHASAPYQQTLFGSLADAASHRLARHAAKLIRWHVPVPQTPEHWPERVWRWLLVHSGPKWTLRWLFWRARRDIRQQLALLQQIRAWLKIVRKSRTAELSPSYSPFEFP